jgi:hypothetical protein
MDVLSAYTHWTSVYFLIWSTWESPTQILGCLLWMRKCLTRFEPWTSHIGDRRSTTDLCCFAGPSNASEAVQRRRAEWVDVWRWVSSHAGAPSPLGVHNAWRLSLYLRYISLFFVCLFVCLFVRCCVSQWLHMNGSKKTDTDWSLNWYICIIVFIGWL